MLISVKENFDTSTPQGAFALTMFAAIAELEVGMIRERTIAALDERGIKFDYKAGMLSLGYVRIVDDNGEHIAINEADAWTVRGIFDMTRRGKSAEYIAKSLNQRGMVSRKGKSGIRQVFVAGLFQTRIVSGKLNNKPFQSVDGTGVLVL